MADKTITGIVTWLKGWFYDKDEVVTLISNTGGITYNSLFDTLDCVNDNFDILSSGNYTRLLGS